MKAAVGACILCLALMIGAAPVHPSDDLSARAAATVKPAGSLAGNFEKVDFQPSCKCGDFAHTSIFMVNRLQYVQTPEFAEAVRMLASGNSKYSPRNPREVPMSSWRTFAAELDRHSAAGERGATGTTVSAVPPGVLRGDSGVCFFRVEEKMIPALLYLASLEYRSLPGHDDVTPIFPRYFRAAISELDARMGEKQRMAAAFARRAAAIKARIAEAERRGPGNCPPELLARAKSELDSAYRDAMGVRSSLQETDMAFARAERAADNLLAR